MGNGQHEQRAAGMPAATTPVPGPLTVAAVARRLGVAPATLRTWDRRYGVGPSSHASGSHRRYDEADLALLERMRRLVQEGVPAVEAARLARGPAAGAAPATTPETVAPSGGRVLSIPGAESVVRGLGAAAMALDGDGVTRIAREQIARRGVLGAWDEVLRPVLAAAGTRWAATGDGVEVEHLLSECVAGALRQVPVVTGGKRRPVVLACAPDDQHALPLHALAAALAERGVASRVLGAATPVPALVATMRRTGPAVLFLWSQLRATGDVGLFAELPQTRPATRVVVGGPGWSDQELPPSVVVAEDLRHAVRLVEETQGLAAPATG